MTHPPSHSTPAPLGKAHWNWPHLTLLAALAPFAWLSILLGMAPSTTLTVGSLLALVWLMVAERRWPARQEWTPGVQALSRDGAFLGINAVFDAAGAWMLTLLALQFAEARPGLAAHLPAWVAVPAAIALGELGPYALHRWAHRGGWWWRVHGLHHAPDQVNASNSVTAHPFNVLWNQLARTLPWIVLGFDAHAMLWAALFVQVQSFAVHANIAGTLGPLNRWLGSAELHRWHHSVDQREALNFSTALPLWDQVFGTYRPPCTAGPVRVGLAGPPTNAGWAYWVRMLMAPVCSRCAP